MRPGRHLPISLERENGIVRLEVADDGCGLDPTPRGASRGLQNLAARERELGGRQHWETHGGSGSRLIVEVPMEPAPHPPTA